MLGRYISRVLGYAPRTALEESERAAAEEYARKYSGPQVHHQGDRNGPYSGRPVPQEALFEEGSNFLDEWHNDWLVAPASNRMDGLVFPSSFAAETEAGEVIYEEDGRLPAETHPARRLAHTIAIHERLESGETSCKRVVKFFGSTQSCYRIEYPASSISWNSIPGADEKPDALLALHQRWALQYLSACRFIHSKGIVINAAPSIGIWLRPDLSLVVAAFVGASCRELDIPAGHLEEANALVSPFGPSEIRQCDPPFGVDECGQPKTDLFYWACWVYTLMTSKDRRRLNAGEKVLLDDRHPLSDEERDAQEVAVREGRFADWPVLQTEQLGPCLLKAWKGDYESAEEALQDVRSALGSCGRILSATMDDEIEGFEWKVEFRP